jgi:Ni/Fe-hydrogenase b-type cytochrome subunit
MHWTAAACIVVLVVTGFSLGKPYFFVREGGPHFVTVWMRFLHLTAAAVLVATGIFRAWLLLAGNRFERWTALVPHTLRDLRNMGRQAVYYATIRVDEAPRYLGHNPMQQLSYLGLYAVVVVMVVTGFALYGLSEPGGFFGRGFGWVHDLLGGSPHTRLVHHVLTWVFLVFVPVHVYLSLRADVVDDPGLVSSMITGGRWVETDDHEDLPAEEIRELGTNDPEELLRRADGLAAVLAGIAGGLTFAFVQALATVSQGGALWPPQDAIGALLLGRDFVTTADTVPGFVLALVGLVGHGILSIVFGVLIAILVHRMGTGSSLVMGALAGLALFGLNVAGVAATVVGVGTPWALLPAHLAFGLVAAATYKATAGRRRA